MKAGLAFPTFTLDEWNIYSFDLLEGSKWTWNNMIEYDSHAFAAAFFNFFHRTLHI